MSLWTAKKDTDLLLFETPALRLTWKVSGETSSLNTLYGNGSGIPSNSIHAMPYINGRLYDVDSW